METFSALLALCEENSPVTGEFPSQRPVTRSFDVFFLSAPEQTVHQTIETTVIWDAIALITWRHCSVKRENSSDMAKHGKKMYIVFGNNLAKIWPEQKNRVFEKKPLARITLKCIELLLNI